MKNIFTKTLTLIAFLSLSIGVWGDPYLSLTFDASGKKDNGQMLDDSYNLTKSGKEWTTSDFYYSQPAEDKIKNNAGFSDGKSHMSLGEASKFRSKNTYHFDAGTYTVVLTAYGRDNSKCDVPDLYIGDSKYTSRDKDYVENIGNGNHQDITYTITTTGGDLYVKGEFIKTTNLSENVGWGELIFTKATPTTFTITYDANNATSGSVPAATVGNGNVTLATNSGNLARTGYTFSGWNTKSDGTGTSYAVGANYNLTANITLYAKWTEIVPPCTAPTSVSLSNGKTNDWGYFGGETITLTATPNGGSTPTGYQWYFNDNEINGAISDTYTINSCSVENGGNYKCKVITGDDCNCTSDNYGIKVYALQCYTNGTFTYNFTRDGNSKIGTLILAREANYYYEYKIATGSDYYGNDGRISRDVLDWTFEPNKANVKFDAGFIAGDYTFTINYTDNGGAPKLSVMYPRRSVFVGLCNDWKGAEAKYAIYYERKSNASDNGWTGWMSAPDCDNDTRVASDVPVWADKYVICRYNPSTASPGSWESGTLWNQTCDINADASKNYYTNLNKGNDNKYYGEWSTYSIETSYNVSAGHKIFFDNSTTKWSNVFFRIGRKCYSSKYDMTLVPGTQSLYQYSIPQWDNYVAFHVADNCAHEGDGKNIYDVRPGSYNIDNCTSFIKEAITEDFTITPTTTTSGGSLPNYYDYNKSYGMLTHKVTLNEVANGTINVAYTDVAGSAQNLTSGSADLAHTCILTITFTPAQGYSATSFQVNGEDFTSGSPLILTEDITISATCAVNQHKVTINLDGGTIADGTWTLESGSYYKMFNFGSTISLPTPTKTGFSFNGWAPAVPETMPDEDVTLTATWTEKPKVDALIVTPDNESYMSGQGGNATMSCSKEDDTYFTGHKVLKFTFSNMNDHWNGYEIGKDKAYNSSSSAGATGFGFWYKTEGDFTLAFCFDYDDDGNHQLKRTLPSTNNTWKYMYVANSAANGWNRDHIRIYVNGTDYAQNWPGQSGQTVTSVNSGTFYITEITATEITEKFINYTVTFDQPSKGSTSAQIVDGEAITSGTKVPEGTDVIFTWNEVTGYDFVSFYDGTNTYTQNPCTLTVNSNLNIITTVDKEVTKHTLTVNADDNGSVSPAGETKVGEGREVTITATPNSHYGFASWTATGISLAPEQEKQNPLTITMPTNDVTLTASFEYVYVDAMIVTGNSATTGNESSGSSASVTPTSVPDPNNFFDHNVWEMSYTMPSGGYAGIHINRDAGYTPASSNGATGFGFYYMTEPGQTIAFCLDYGSQKKTQLPSTNGFWKYAYVESSSASNWNNSSIIIYQNATDNASGSWTPNTLPGSGGTTTTPATGKYYIAEICATERTTKPEQTPVYTATFAANPSNMATVTATVDDAPIASGDAVDAGKSITFDYSNVDANYRFTGWTATGISLIDAQKQEHPLTLKMPSASISLTANFVRVYTLVVNKDEHITEVTGAGQYEAGAEVTVTATAAQGYKFTNWTAGAGGTQLATTSSYTFTMPATDNYTVYANSEEDITYYKITLGECINGTISAKMNDQEYTGAEVTANTPIVLTATPNTGYAFVSWKDGSTDNPHTIYANAETETLNPWTATFAQVYTVSVELGKPGKEVIGVGKYPGGAQVTLTAVANTKDSQDKTYDLEYQLKEWTVTAGGVDIAAKKSDNPLTFTMPFANVSMKATFAPVECVDTYTIQCEDDQAYIPYNTQGSDLTIYPHGIPHVDGCGRHSDYYTEYHGTGYYDFKEATNTEMYYPVELPASTYKFEVWSATNDNKHCAMNLYLESNEANPDVVYLGKNYKRAQSVEANNYGPDRWPFKISGTISDIELSQPKSVIIGLYCGSNYGAYDQIRITATEHVFCAPLSTTDFVIKSDEIKEIPVCGVDNLTIYDGGQANNYDDVEVFKQVKYSRTVAALDEWETFAVPYTATGITVQDIPNKDYEEYPVWPIYRTEDGYETGYFYMEELKGEDATLMGRPFATRWEISENKFPQQNVPYIIRFPREQSDGYFANTQINYISTYNDRVYTSVTLTGKKNATIIEEDYPSIEAKPTFYFYANNTLANIQLETSAYILNESGMNFDIVDQPVIPPFHCYVQATKEIKQMYPHLAMRNDGGGTTILIPLTEEDWKSMQAKKVLIGEVIYIVRDGKLYSIMGQLVK